MSKTMRGWFNHFEKSSADFGVSKIDGTSLTIPGQGSDLAVIIQSIVKLPPLEDRFFDSPANQEPDLQTLELKLQMESMYRAEAANEAEEAQARIKARKKAKEEKEKEAPPDSDGGNDNPNEGSD